jgi:hypothetical protein
MMIGLELALRRTLTCPSLPMNLSIDFIYLLFSGSFVAAGRIVAAAVKCWAVGLPAIAVCDAMGTRPMATNNMTEGERRFMQMMIMQSGRNRKLQTVFNEVCYGNCQKKRAFLRLSQFAKRAH